MKKKLIDFKYTRHRLFSCKYHVIFCPSHRRKQLKNGVDSELKKLILLKQIEYGYEVRAMEVMPNHVHLLLSIDPKIGIHKIVSKIKGFTSFSLNKMYHSYFSGWSRTSFISSVGSVSLKTVKDYIENQ